MCSLLGTYRIPIPLPRSTMGPELDAVGVRPHHSITFYNPSVYIYWGGITLRLVAPSS